MPQGRRDVQLITGAVGISALGDFLLWIPLTLHLQDMTDSAIAVAALFVALWAPVVVLAPAAGLLVDRMESRALLVGASLAQAGVAAGLAFALDSVAAILVLAALLGGGFAVAQPAEFALVPVIGRGRDLTRLNGYVESSRYIGMMAGPVAGGILGGVGGTEAAMLVNAASFAAVAVAGLMLHARRPPGVPEEGETDRARDGIVHLFRDRELGLVMWVVFVSLLFMTATVTAEVFFLREDLEVGETLYGLIFGTWVVGMAFGALVIARRVPKQALALGTLVGVGMQSVGVGLPAAVLAAWFCAALWLVGGMAHGTKNVLARTLIQERVPERVHGRAFAAYNGLRNGAELIAIAAGGLLVAVLGARVTLALAGAFPLAAALVGLTVYVRSGARRLAPSAPPT